VAVAVGVVVGVAVGGGAEAVACCQAIAVPVADAAGELQATSTEPVSTSRPASSTRAGHRRPRAALRFVRSIHLWLDIPGLGPPGNPLGRPIRRAAAIAAIQVKQLA